MRGLECSGQGESPQALQASAAQTISNVSQTDIFIKYEENVLERDSAAESECDETAEYEMNENKNLENSLEYEINVKLL